MDPRIWLSICLPDPLDEDLARASASLQEASEPGWVAAAVRERLGPLLYWRLTSLIAPVPVPEPVRQAFWKSASTSSLRTRWTGVLLAALARGGVAASPLTGAWLAACVYPGAALRPYRDPDLLVAPDDVPEAHEALLSLGLNPEEDEPASGFRSSQFSQRYLDPEGRLSCRLHWGLAGRRRPWVSGRNLLPLARQERGLSGTYLDLPAAVHFLHLLLQQPDTSGPLPRLLVDLAWMLARFGRRVAEEALELASAFGLQECARRSLASLALTPGLATDAAPKSLRNGGRTGLTAPTGLTAAA